MLMSVISVIILSVDAMMPGGFKPCNLKDPATADKLAKLTEFALAEIAKERFEQQQLISFGIGDDKLVTHSQPTTYVGLVSEAKSQIVAGVKYVMSVLMAEKDCGGIGNNDCKYETCELSVWEKSWEQFVQLVDYKCEVMQLGILLGGKKLKANKVSSSIASRTEY